jgi:hypothetical protein
MLKFSVCSLILAVLTLAFPNPIFGQQNVDVAKMTSSKEAADAKVKAPKFSFRQLALDSNEGIAAGDINGDGVTDLVAGRQWYAGPSPAAEDSDGNGEGKADQFAKPWAPRPLRIIKDWSGYVESNGDYLFDVNDDGRLDVIAGSFIPKEVYWFENPGSEGLRLGKLWKSHLLVDTGNSNNEGQLFEDLDGDGRPEWIVNSWKSHVPTVVWRLVPKNAGEGKENKTKPGEAAYEMVSHELGPKGNGHGTAVGDLSGDGRPDVLTGQGWFEQPESDPWAKPWQFHAAWNLYSSLPMLVVDLDKDGDNDLIYGNGHNYGIFWWENVGKDGDGEIEWEKHEIDSSFSQAHALAWADISGDGEPDLITGKRYYAHNGSDPGGKGIPCLYYYTWDAAEKKFTRHKIDEGHVGVGLQIVAQDITGDGKVDIAVSGKSGTYLIETK